MKRLALVLSAVLAAACSAPGPSETYDYEPTHREPTEPTPPEEQPDAGTPQEPSDAGTAPDAAPPSEPADAGVPDADPPSEPDAGQPPPPPPASCRGPEGSPVASVSLTPRSFVDSQGVTRDGLAPTVRVDLANPTPASSVVITAWYRLPSGSHCTSGKTMNVTTDAAGRLTATQTTEELQPPVESEMGAQTHRVDLTPGDPVLVNFVELAALGDCRVPGVQELDSLVARGGDDWSPSSPERVVVTVQGATAWGCAP